MDDNASSTKKGPANLEPGPATPASQSPEKEPKHYSPGHSPEEIRRLEAQGRFFAPPTRVFLRSVDITPGMRALDVGCGIGDVSFLLADLVGPTGEVVGFDYAEPSIAVADARARDKGLTNVRFVQCNIDNATSLAADGPFDAVVSRVVLCHLANPLDALRKLLRLVRPGGVVGFMEAEMSAGFWSMPRLTILDQIQSHMFRLVERGFSPKDLLSDFVTAFNEVGITQRQFFRASAIFSASDDDACTYVGEMAQGVHRAALRVGFPPPDYDPATVIADFKKEAMSKNALFDSYGWIGAVGRLPAARGAACGVAHPGDGAAP